MLIIALVYLYLKCRQRQIRNRKLEIRISSIYLAFSCLEQRQTYMSTGIPMYNNEREHPIPYTFSYPPHYSALAEESFDKLPSYEQSVQGVSEDDNVNIINNGPATIPISISTEGISGANKTQT